MLTRIPHIPPRIDALTGTDRPLWSVMIPVYNCFEYIKETLESVLLQDPGVALMQIEVVDDCSTDGDVQQLVNEIGKGRVSYFRQEKNSGSLRNFETCINRAQGHLIHLLHGDDKVIDGYYNEIEGLFNDNPSAGAAFTDFDYIDYKSSLVKIKNYHILNEKGIIPNFIDMIAVRQLLQPPSIVVKRSTYETLGSFYAVHFGEDWEMWTRIASKFPVAYSPKVLASYRVGHGMGISHHSYLSGQNILDIRKVIDIMQNYLPPERRAALKKAALANYARFCIRIANSLILSNAEAALKQIEGAWNMDKGPNTIAWILRFYAMRFLKYKQLERMLNKK
jgi:glycosyltransferase involved in cell wall biosynthesis